MKIIIGADPLGYALKETVKKYLLSADYNVTDITASGPAAYYQVGADVGRQISDGAYDRGIIFCGTGMGVNIVANKFPGVYCGLCESPMTARLCRIINNCNVLALGGLLNGSYKAVEMVKVFLNTEFAEGFSEASPEFLRDACAQVALVEQSLASKSR